MSPGPQALPAPAPKLAALTVFLACMIAAWAMWNLWDFTCDDALITLRYSRNLAQGAGPTYNREPPPRAEGYTSFLWMLLAAVPHLALSDPVGVAKAAGVLFTLLTIAACLRTAWLLCDEVGRGERLLSAALAAAFFAAYPLTAVHGVSGMETALAAFLASLLGWLAVRGEAGPPGRALPLCALLLGLTRPELNLAALAVILVVGCRLNVAARGPFLRAVALWYVLPGALYFAWRATYYEALLPLPFYVKGAAFEPRGLISALHFGFDLAGSLGLFLAVAIAGIGSRSKPIVWAVIAVMIYLLHPEHVMGFGHRFFQPLVPLIAALSARGAALILSAVSQRFGQKRAAFAHAALLAVALAPVICRYPLIWNEFREYAAGMNRAHVRLGKLLRQHAPREGAVLAIRDAGAVPYYSDWETVDCAGLNDRHVARAGVASPAYVFGRRPALVVLQSRRPDRFLPHEPAEQAIYEECLRRGMANIGTLEFTRGYYLWLMAQPDTPLARSLTLELGRPPGSTP